MSQLVGRKLPPDRTGTATGVAQTSDHRRVSAEKIDHHGNAGLAVTNYGGVLLTKIDDAGGGITYVGEAACGSATDEPKWRIQRITVLGLITTIEWARNDTTLRYGEFDVLWDGHAGWTYG